MQNLLQQQPDQFSSHLLQQQTYFQNDLSIINFIPREPTHKNKKIGITAWNDALYQNGQQSQRNISLSPKIHSQKKTIEDFLSTIKNKNGEFVTDKIKLWKYGKKSSLDSFTSQKSEAYIPLNNTLILFPKSRSQSRKIQGEQKIILEKLYRKRQKSKVIPKQISINPSFVYGMTEKKFPAKNYLAKNRSFIDEKSPKKNSNPEERNILINLRRKFPNSYYKKVGGLFNFEESNSKLSPLKEQKSLQYGQIQKSPLKGLRKLTSLKEELENSPLHKMYRTIQINSKLNSINLGCEKQLSISKVRQDAKNTHLNRIKKIEKNDIQLLGSTITKWKNQAYKKLQGKQ